MKNVAIILGAGSGGRFNSKLPKQFVSLNGKIVCQYVIDTACQAQIKEVYFVCPNQWFDFAFSHCKEITRFIVGGKTRTESIRNALNAIPTDADNVIFLDAVRPFITVEHINNCLDALTKYKAVCTVQRVTDAIAWGDITITQELDREILRLVQTPEAFDYKTIYEAYKKKNMRKGVAIFSPLLNKVDIKTIPFDEFNLKITYQKDLFLAEQMLKYSTIEQTIPNLKGLKVLLFGASGGIGTAVQQLLLERGATVMSPNRQDFDLNNIVYTSDLYNEKFNCIINCIGAYLKDTEGLIGSYLENFEVNVEDVIHILEEAPDRWLSDGGNIILIGSAAASYGRKGIGTYAASKAALNTLVESLHEEFNKKYNIKLNVICPAKVDTKLQTYFNPDTPKSEMMTPKEIAEIIVRYCTVNYSGKIVYVKAGLNYDT